jgi:NAD+ synthase (glutamine-hydrolysing)
MVRLALAQVNLTVGDVEGNARKVLKWIEKAGRRDADIVAFPELAISGYPAEDLLLKRRFLKDCGDAIQGIAKHVKRMVAVVGFPSVTDSVYNSAAVLHRGKIISVCSKIHLPNYGVFDEKRYFSPGGRTCVIVLGESRIGVSICEDIWQGDVPAAHVSRAGAHVTLNISCSPYHLGKGSEREELMRERAVSNNAYVAYLNLVGGQDELVFDGHSVIVSPNGTVLARGKQFVEDLLVADIDTRTLRRATRKKNAAKATSISVKTVNLKTKPKAQKKRISSRIHEPMDRLEEIYCAIVTGTRDYVRKNGFRRVVVGLSGGIDSSLVAVLAVDALGKDSVVGVSMPSRYSSPESVTDARKLAKKLGIRFMKFDIDRVFKAYLGSLRPVLKRLTHDTAEENIQARIRGNILMALSNKFGWLVLTTGNKSELAVGYCTLYGDLAGGFAILKDVPKTLVYELAAYRNSKGKAVIPDAVMVKPPSAELKPDQKDEDSLPPYEILDPVLNLYVVGDLAIDEIVDKGFPRNLVRRVAGLVDGNEYKRRQGPPGIKITPRAFGKDRRMPITNYYR